MLSETTVLTKPMGCRNITIYDNKQCKPWVPPRLVDSQHFYYELQIIVLILTGNSNAYPTDNNYPTTNNDWQNQNNVAPNPTPGGTQKKPKCKKKKKPQGLKNSLLFHTSIRQKCNSTLYYIKVYNVMCEPQ